MASHLTFVASMQPVVALFLSLIMLVGGLMPQNDVEELGKLPQLVQHYKFHQSTQGGELSFRQFLGTHYGAGSTAMYQCPPSPEHDQLPLHGQHHCPNLEYVVPAQQLIVAISGPRRPACSYQSVATVSYTYAYCGGLLQPPRA